MRGLAAGSGVPLSRRPFGMHWRTSGGGTTSKPRSAHFRSRSMTGTPILPVGSDHSGGGIAAGAAETSLGGGLLYTTTLIDGLRPPPAAGPLPAAPPSPGAPHPRPIHRGAALSGA